ncbi:hypothetical protein [Halalkalirubrum salinum]|uniref:hypothetical protein n=1 Tax=Halalkalirubrum salinum TaxID=2563889 RepID=UPI0010FAD692|nr:hypothetical protein [Halalkalirubrum salinum]
MERRDLLASIGAGSTIGLAGCLGDVEILMPPASRNNFNGTEDAERPEIADIPCPPYKSDHDRSICSHVGDTDTAAVSLMVRPERTTLDDGTPTEDITLTFHNQSASDLRFNPHSWRFWYHSNGEWTQLPQNVSGSGLLTVSAGASYSWSFSEAIESIQPNPTLDPGLYAAEIGVPDPIHSDQWVGCMALVQFDTDE